MINQPYGPFLGEADCEDLPDFAQYYKGRYFACDPGLVGAGTTEEGELLPVYLYRANANSDVHLVYLDAKSDALVEVHLGWSQIKKGAKFGHPLLGTFPHGPTYSYASQHAYRESTKGVGLSRIVHHVPGFDGGYYGNLMHAFVTKKEPKFLSVLHGKNFGAVEELRIVKQLYNKKMFEWQEALLALETGQRIGANISLRAGIHFLEGHEDIKLSYKDKIVGDLVKSDGDTGYAEIKLKPPYTHLIPIIRAIVPGKVVVY